MRSYLLVISLLFSTGTFASTKINCQVDGVLSTFKKHWLYDRYQFVVQASNSKRYGMSWDLCKDYKNKKFVFWKDLEKPNYKVGDKISLHCQYSDNDGTNSLESIKILRSQ